jgi:enoyl-CoA hydratase/carnithine racemase
MNATLRGRRDGAVWEIEIDNPDKRNALDGRLCHTLALTLREASAKGVRALILTGEGERAFCSGFDLNELTDGGIAYASHAFGEVLDAVAASDTPLICAMNGPAIGDGCELAAACDVRVAHAGVRLAMPPARFGFVYPPRRLARFAALCGESRARQLFLLAREVDAETALAWGLVDHVVAPEQVLPLAREIAEGLRGLDAAAVASMRASFEALLHARVAREGG